MGFFDIEKLKKEQETIETNKQQIKNQNEIVLREFVETTKKSFDLFAEMSKEFPELAKIYNKKTTEIRTDIKNKKDFMRKVGRNLEYSYRPDIAPIYEYEYVFRLPFPYDDFGGSYLAIDSKGRLVDPVLKQVFPGPFRQFEEQNVRSLEPYTRLRFEEDLKLAIQDKYNRSTNIWVEKDRVNVRLSSSLLTLPFFLIKRSFHFKTEGCKYQTNGNVHYEVPYHISIDKRRTESEVIELIKNEFLVWAKSDYLYEDSFSG